MLKTFKKILASTAVVAMVASVMPMISFAAFTDVEIQLGNHEGSQQTSYMLTLTQDIAMEASDTLLLDFHADVNISALAFGDFAFRNVTDTVNYSSAATPGANTFGVAISGQEVTITAPTSYSAGAIGANDTWRVYMGPQDVTLDSSWPSTGQDSYITNPASEGSYYVSTLYTDASTSDTFSGDISFPILSTALITVEVMVLPFITVDMGDTSINASNPLAANAAVGGSSIGYDTATFTVDTNHDNGYSIKYYGAALTNAETGDTWDALLNAAATTTAEGWGLNLMNNATPNVGADPVSTAGATPDPLDNYDTADFYTFGASTATSKVSLTGANGPSDGHAYTLSAAFGASVLTEPGNYDTTLTLSATAEF